MQINKKSIVGLFLSVVLLFTGCGTPKNVAYMQDIAADTILSVAQVQNIRVKEGDKIFIIVKSRDPRLSGMFNLETVTTSLGRSFSKEATPQGLIAYEVDKEGNIVFPELGTLHIAGLTRSEIAKLVHDELINRQLLKNAVVSVDFDNLSVTVMGEVKQPGRYNIEKDHVTLLDVLSMAGDITIDGKRTNVLVQRDLGNGKYRYYRVNLTSGHDLSASPAYYMQQNDVVYVSPTNKRERETTVSANQWRSPSLWVSLGSLMTTIAVIIIKK